MAAKNSKQQNAIKKLTALPGVGKATAEKMVKVGINSITDIAKSGAKGLAKAGLTGVISKKILAAAKAEVKSTVKATPKKAKSAAKSAAKSVAKSAEKKKAAVLKKAKGIATTTKATSKKALGTSKKATEVVKKATKAVTEKIGSDKTVQTKKATDGRKGSTLKVPRSVKDMPWFKG